MTMRDKIAAIVKQAMATMGPHYNDPAVRDVPLIAADAIIAALPEYDASTCISGGLNLSGWIERRKSDVGPYAEHIIRSVRAYEAELTTHRGDDVHPVEAAMREANVLRPNDLLASGPTDAAVNDVCLSYRHDFGLLDVELQNGIRMDARFWYEAWTKLLDHLPAAPTETLD